LVLQPAPVLHHAQQTGTHCEGDKDVVDVMDRVVEILFVLDVDATTSLTTPEIVVATVWMPERRITPTNVPPTHGRTRSHAHTHTGAPDLVIACPIMSHHRYRCVPGLLYTVTWIVMVPPSGTSRAVTSTCQGGAVTTPAAPIPIAQEVQHTIPVCTLSKSPQQAVSQQQLPCMTKHATRKGTSHPRASSTATAR
jgi:hypothetical protein